MFVSDRKRVRNANSFIHSFIFVRSWCPPKHRRRRRRRRRRRMTHFFILFYRLQVRTGVSRTRVRVYGTRIRVRRYRERENHVEESVRKTQSNAEIAASAQTLGL